MIIDVVGYRRGSPKFSLVAPSCLHALLPPWSRPFGEKAGALDRRQASQNNTEDTETARRPRRSQDSGASRGVGSDSCAKRQNLTAPWPPCRLRVLRVILTCLLAGDATPRSIGVPRPTTPIPPWDTPRRPITPKRRSNLRKWAGFCHSGGVSRRTLRVCWRRSLSQRPL